MWLMLQQKEADDYVIATGEATRCRDWSSSPSVTPAWTGEIRQDRPALPAAAEVDQLIGDASKARQSLAGQPSVSSTARSR
jgi:GDPmannose 4,6-dehydratase